MSNCWIGLVSSRYPTAQPRSLSGWNERTFGGESDHTMWHSDERVSYRWVNFGHFVADFFHFLDGAHCNTCIYTIIRAQNLTFLNINSGRAWIVLARLPKNRICGTYFWIIKMPGCNRAIWDDYNAYKIIIFGQFVVEIWMSEVPPRKVTTFHTSANFDANSNKQFLEWNFVQRIFTVTPPRL